MKILLPRRGARLAVVLVAAVGLLAACSSSSKSASTSTSTTASGSTSPSAAKPTGAPIKVGMICTCSGGGGFGAFDVPARDVYQAWVNNVNASGGVQGHPVQLIVEDDTGNPGTALSSAQTLISDHVVAIADMSLVDSAFGSAVEQAGIPVVGIETNNTLFGQSPDFFPEAQTNNSAIQGVIATAKTAGATNLANVYCAESPVCAQSVPAFKTIGQQGGVPVVYNAEISATAPNYTAQCVAAQQQKVTSIFIGDASAIIAKFASNCAAQGYQPVYLAEGAGFGMVEATAPGLKDKLWVPFPALPFFASTPAINAANAAIDKYYPGVRNQAEIFNQDDFEAWTSAVLLEHAIKAGGLTSSATPTAAEVLQGLYSLKGDDLGGLTSPLTFTKGQGHNVNCWFTARVQNGTPQLVGSGTPTCANG